MGRGSVGGNGTVRKQRHRGGKGGGGSRGQTRGGWFHKIGGGRGCWRRSRLQRRRPHDRLLARHLNVGSNVYNLGHQARPLTGGASRGSGSGGAGKALVRVHILEDDVARLRG